MLRPFRARGVLLVTSLLAAGCQDYNFNPVGHCLIQPGSKRVTLSNVSTADVLFVVDESGSMGGEQIALRDNFDVFVDNLDQANVDRAGAGLDPIDFHLAVTTTSVFWNRTIGETCSDTCGSAAGQAVCCAGGSPALRPKACTMGGPAAQCPTGTACSLGCAQLKGEPFCCDGTGAAPMTERVPCARERVGTACGSLETHYDFQGCTAPIVQGDEWPYPQGDFVSRFTAGPTSPPNPRVIHFDKELYTGGANKQGYTSGQLVQWFKENVEVGTCGSGEEQALQAARLALQKAFAGQQKDSRTAAGAVAWTPALFPDAPARWPSQGVPSKLVLVFVGDEDDCSSPADPAGGVVMIDSERAGADACVRDGLQTTPAALRNKQFPVSEFVEYFTSLGRPVAAGFILPAAQNSCTLNGAGGTEVCTTSGLCCGPTGACSSTVGAQAPGSRLLATAHALAQAGVEVVAGSMCDSNFGTILNDIAEIVKPPSGLELPTVPAQDEVTLLRIATPDGQTRKLCSRPQPARDFPTLAQAQAEPDPQTGRPYDWWFTLDGAPGDPVSVSQFVYINPKGSCVANPGETYSADYLGRLPEGGCWDDPAYDDEKAAGVETSADAMCRSVLGGQAGSWTCFAGGADTQSCAAPVQSAPGTCICGGRSKNCPNDAPPP